MYCCSNCCNSSVVVSWTLFLISSRSPSIKVMGSTYILPNFYFLWEPSYYCSLHFLSQNGVLFPSSPLPPYANFASSSMASKVDLPILCDARCSCSACSFAVHPCSIRAFSVASFFRCATNFCAAYFAASFLFFSADLLVPLLVPTSKFDGVRHSTGHRLITSYMSLFVTKYAKSYHFCCESFPA